MSTTIDTIREISITPEVEDWGVTVPIEDLAEFLADPIGYGQYDPSDPITLDEFTTAHHVHGFHAAPLAS